MDPDLRHDVGDPDRIRFGARRRRGSPVFRLVRNRMTPGMVAVGVAGAVSGAVVGGGATAIVVALCAVGATIGAIVGQRFRVGQCTGCDAPLPLDAIDCKRCDARVAGDIRHRSQLAEAEAKWRKDLVARRAAGLEPEEEEDEPGPSSLG